MGILSNLRDRFIVAPVAKRITDSLTTKEPNIFAVPVGFNSGMAAWNKRMTSGSVDWTTLRSLSINHETTRAAINVRKRQITQLGYDIVDLDDDTNPDNTLGDRQTLRDIITHIGGDGLRFRALLDRMIEDVLVLDALAIYKQRDRSGKLLKLLPIDAATIKLRVDPSGGRPDPPEIAFEQWIRGQKTADMTTDDLSYEMMNPRNDSPYGLSPLESLLITLDSSMRAMLYNLNYLSDNNVPQGWLAMPEGWTPDQIKEYKEWLDAIIGSSKAQAKIYPIPAGTTYQATSKPSDFAFREMFDYLDRKVCMMFDLSPQELGITLKQYKENADGQEKIQIRKGIKPLANFLQEIFTDIIQDEFGYRNFAFKFTGLDGRFSPEDMKALIPIGVINIDEARNDIGLKKLGVDNFVITGMGITPVSQIGTTISGQPNPQIEDEEEVAEDPSAEVNEKMVKEVSKRARNTFFEKLTTDPQFRKFKTAVKKGIINQIEPFTTVEGVSKVLPANKADTQQTVNDITLNLKIEGLDKFLAWAFQQGGQNALKSLKINDTFNVKNPKYADMIANRANYLIDSVDDTTKSWIVDQISEGKDNSLTNDEIAQGIADDIDEISDSRADTIVNTEVANATQTAELETYKDQGIDEKTWVTSEDELVCPICEPLDGEIEKVDDSFSSGDDAPPAHPNCRCYIQAVLEKSTNHTDLKKDWVTIGGNHVFIGDGSGGDSTATRSNPAVSQTQAEKFASTSAVKDTMYQASDKTIQEGTYQNGFKADENGIYGKGVYLHTSAAAAISKGSGLSLVKAKVNVLDVKSVNSIRDLLQTAESKGLSLDQLTKTLVKRYSSQYDALHVKHDNTLVVFNAKNVLPFK